MNSGQQLSHYNIIRDLGKGGMGEVYLAEDTTLDRHVAIKVLPDTLRKDPERLARFRREARAAASLKHHNIATIYALEEVGEVLFIVMEYVEGHTLSELIPKEGMDLDTFFNTFIPLSDALAHAHDQGRIHRDLKPGNIMVTPEGIPKILDFGLARITHPSSASQLIDSEAPTQTMKVVETLSDPSAMTEGLRLLGTPMYMSPEQAEMTEIDHRSDLFSFGVVMYEALTGRRPFEGNSQMSLLGRIVNENPEPITDRKPGIPHLVWEGIRRCLEKDRMERTQTARELHAELRHIHSEVDAGLILVDARALPDQKYRQVPVWQQPLAIMTTIMMFGIGLVLAWSFKPDKELHTRKFQWPVDELGSSDPFGGPAISPDGEKVAYVADGVLWIRNFNNLTPRRIQDTRDAREPFWAPNSEFVAYFNKKEGFLGKIRIDGGKPQRICSLPNRNDSSAGGTWHDNGIILFSDIDIYEVPASGGEARLVVEADSTVSHYDYPQYLPDGETIIFVKANRTGAHGPAYRSGGETKPFLQHLVTRSLKQSGVPSLFYNSTGHIVYRTVEGGVGFVGSDLWVVPFSAKDLTTEGEPVLLAEKVTGHPSMSNDGTLAYRAGSSFFSGNLAWVNRSGSVIGTIGQPKENMSNPVLSPDNRYVAVDVADSLGDSDIWVYDTNRNTATVLTFSPQYDGRPTWSPDGTELIFESWRNANQDLFRIRRGSGDVRSVISAPGPQVRPDWSSNGRDLVYQSDIKGNSDLWVLKLDSGEPTSVLMETEYDEVQPALSPNGRYVAYTSTASGKPEVYVARFPSGEERIRVSLYGGIFPKWNGDGTELFFVSGEHLMAVDISTAKAFQAGTPKVLFATETVGAIDLASNYDVAADGQRFVIVQSKNVSRTPTITVVENWGKAFGNQP